MRIEFNGKLELEWISVKDKMPLDEYENPNQILADQVLVLVIDVTDNNEDASVLNLEYSTDKGWAWAAGESYHVPERIRYWCYIPTWYTPDILKFEENK